MLVIWKKPPAVYYWVILPPKSWVTWHENLCFLGFPSSPVSWLAPSDFPQSAQWGWTEKLLPLCEDRVLLWESWLFLCKTQEKDIPPSYNHLKHEKIWNGVSPEKVTLQPTELKNQIGIFNLPRVAKKLLMHGEQVKKSLWWVFYQLTSRGVDDAGWLEPN